jgi:hypothetical protein
MQQSSRKSSLGTKNPNRSRSASLVVPTIVTAAPKRNHSLSISSVALNDSSYSSEDTFKAIPEDGSRGKIRLMDDVDLEKQLILTAGGKREYLCGFILKLLLLTFVVLGCSVLIFYAL